MARDHPVPAGATLRLTGDLRGPGCIAMALRAARRADPAARLYLGPRPAYFAMREALASRPT